MPWLGNLFSGTGSTSGNDFVGQYVELGQQQLKIKKVIAEGGYGFVFIAQDLSSGKEYALKRLMAPDEATSKQIVKEISFFRKLRGHPNIVQYVAAANGNTKQANGMNEYLILTELCTGQLIDVLRRQGHQPLQFQQVLKIFSQVCRAVAHMHKQDPPIIHRDLKIENLLLNSKGIIKLCDFGSATTTSLYPDDSWTALQRSMAEDEIQRNTTPMYRAPEMIDLYSNKPVDTKADVWALGCILYMLCFLVHPFDDSAKLKIMNANYTIPETDKTFTELHQLINLMLNTNPQARPNAEDVHAELIALATDKSIDLKTSAVEATTMPSSDQDQSASTPSGSSVLLGNVVNRAGALFTNIKDVSSKMMNSVAGYVNKDLDVTYVTSRLLVMSFPADGIEGTYKNNIDDVRMYLDSKHTDSYVVINISQRTYRTNKLNDRVYESGWNSKKAPSLDRLVSLCRKLNNFLKQNKKNVVVVHCLDGRVASSVLLSSFFLFCKLFTKASMAEDLFNLRRSNVASPIELTASQRRYMGYIGQLVSTTRYVPHKNTVFLKSLTLSPVPIFNKARTGCRPFIEIYENDKRVLSTAQEIDQMREYSLHDEKIVFQTHVRLNGDITIIVYHGRSTLGGKVQGKLTSITILSLQFHTGFLDKQQTSLFFPKSAVDFHETDDKYPPNFGLTLNMKFTEETSDSGHTAPWEKMHVEKLSPYVCFSSKEEYWKLHEEFGLSEEKTPLCQKSSISSMSDSDAGTPSYTEKDKTVAHSTFFNELAWHSENGEGKMANGQAKYDTDSKATLLSLSSNTEVSNNLIDISSGPRNLNVEEDVGTMSSPSPPPNTATPPLSDSDIPQINLVDPFASLATSRSSKSPDEAPSTDILLNFDSQEDNTASESTSINFAAPESNSASHFNDLFETAPHTSKHDDALKRNKSLDDITNDELFTSAENNIFSSHKSKQPFDPFMKHFHDSPRKSSSESNLMNDLGDHDLNTATLKPERPIHHSASSHCVQESKKPKDPFAEFADLQFGTSSSSNVRTHNAAPGMNQRATASPTPSNQPQQQQKPQFTPNYNVFITPTEAGVFNKTSAVKPQGGWVPKPMSNNDFGDILNSQGFKATSSNQKQTLKQMRATDDDKNDLDPIKRKIRDWSDGKERNIRALLTSLETVLWEKEEKWQKVSMHQLVDASQVKKFYRKACLTVHPDKHTGEDHEDLARAIFIELNEAWTLFEQSGSLSLF